LGDHIKAARLDRGLLQREVAEIMGVSEASISNWELNHRPPFISCYPKIIAFLGYIPFPPPNKSLAQQSLYYRKINGLSQEKLSKLIGVDASTICRMETGVHKFFLKVEKKLRSFWEEHGQ